MLLRTDIQLLALIATFKALVNAVFVPAVIARVATDVPFTRTSTVAPPAATLAEHITASPNKVPAVTMGTPYVAEV